MKPFCNVIRRSLSSIEIQTYLNNPTCSFDKILRGVNVIKIENGDSISETKITEEHVNPMKIAQGGYISTLVDKLTSLALLTHKNCKSTASVSTDLHLSFMKAIECGTEIQITTNTIKCGKNLAYLECKITDKVTGQMYVKANHTKYIIRDKVLKLV